MIEVKYMYPAEPKMQRGNSHRRDSVQQQLGHRERIAKVINRHQSGVCARFNASGKRGRSLYISIRA